eukprot:TRINITY_DN1462_c0_g2_i1.p1 TRINITY_DN1462_c0_g2~~TRINITY_DN1462_c0_g2_i1.p1  ORF type:complete len:310 (-),score=40.38 TRINITY_DN1462_c0_g2_i1:340-1269(-)
MSIQSHLLVCFTLCLMVLCAPKLGDSVATGAAILFGSDDIFVEGPRRTSYGTLGSEFVINELLTSILSNEPSAASRTFLKEDPKIQAPSKVFVFLGTAGQRYVDDVYLRKAWDTSLYGLALPNVVYMDSKSELVDDVMYRLEQVTTGMVGTKLAIVGDCGSSEYAHLTPEQALSAQSNEEGTQMVLWCPSDYSLQVLNDANTNKDYMVMYLSDASTASSRHARMLLQDSEPEPERKPVTETNSTEIKDRSGRVIDYDTCDPKCGAQVRMLEVFFLFWIMIIAMVAGLACTNLLQAPTKFESVKSAAQNE